MRFGPIGIWEIIVIVGVALLIFGPTTLPKIARGVGKAFKTAKDMKDEVTGVVLDDERPPPRKTRSGPPPSLPAAAESAEVVESVPDAGASGDPGAAADGGRQTG